MTGNIALDVVIGLVFIYTPYSLLTTTLVELIATYFQLRARNLAKGIGRMLNDDDGVEVLAGKFYQTPLIKYMASGLWKIYNKPSYIKARNFSKAMMHMLKSQAEGGATTLDKVKSTLEKYKGTQTGDFLLCLLDDANHDLDKFKTELEAWFDDTMERVSGWYKRKIWFITFVVGFVVAAALNVDSIQIVRKLSYDPGVRGQMVSLAGQIITHPELVQSTYDPGLVSRVKADSTLRRRYLNDINGYNKAIADSVDNVVKAQQQELTDKLKRLESYTKEARQVLYFKRAHGKGFIFDSWKNFFGCLATAIALSLGAPFWFDLLNKLVKLRGSIVKTEEKRDEK